MKLAGDIVDRPMPYAGADGVARALARDPALRSLPSDVLARRLGVSRQDAERAIAHMVQSYAGALVHVAGRSFDEAVGDAGSARRQASSPLPMNEAAGFNAGATAIERGSYMRHRMPPGRASLAWRGAMGYQTPPIPDLAAILLSDAFPVTRRVWSKGDAPTSDEIAVLDWSSKIVTAATSSQSFVTLKAFSNGCRSWTKQVNVGGNTLSPRSSSEQGQWWLELQQIMQAVSDGTVVSEHDGSPIRLPWMGMRRWGLPAPKITPDEVDIYYWDLSDASHPRLKMVMWMTKALVKLGANESVIDGTWAKYGAHFEIYVDGQQVKMRQPEGWDAEKDAMKIFAGLGSALSALTTAISAAVAAYCPACSVAVKIAGQLAVNAANGAVTTKALASYGDQMLTDAAVKAARGDTGSINALRAFAGALIGLAPGATAGAQPNGGLVYDYLSTLNNYSGNVPAALYTMAIDHTNKIMNAADLGHAAGVPLLDAQYAVAAMTDTLSRFASNVSSIYLDPNETWTDIALHSHVASRTSFQNKNILQNLPLIPPGQGQAPPAAGVSPVVVAGAAIGAAWYLGLLKGLL